MVAGIGTNAPISPSNPTAGDGCQRSCSSPEIETASVAPSRRKRIPDERNGIGSLRAFIRRSGISRSGRGGRAGSAMKSPVSSLSHMRTGCSAGT